ncbi:MAG: peptide/nickel transport system substrate-binding protein, partial [Streptomyces sp.]|nr:peptide/nickel transport system substrate-binding protein [Streptomyces sp.]
RDIKPGNVMITEEGALKVADFGIARVLHSEARLTTTGSAIGTPSYMSPEQINGSDVDARSDVYAVGCVLVELLTARPPFTDGNPINLMYWHVHTPPPVPSSRNPSVPPELDELVLAALAKSPADRPAGGAAYRDRLRGWLAANAAATLSGPAAVPVPVPISEPAPESVEDPGSPLDPSADRRADPRATFFGVGPGAGLPLLPPAAATTPAPEKLATPSTPAATPASTPVPTPASAAATPPPVAVSEATPPPARETRPVQPEHPAYHRAPQVPLPPPYQPSTPPPFNIQSNPVPAPVAQPARRRRGRWIAIGAGIVVAAVGVSVTLAFAPFGGKGGGGGDPTPTVTAAAQDAALKLHGGKEGSGYGGGLDGVVSPSSTKGGTLNLVGSYEPLDMLDPAASYDQTSWNVQRLFLRKLVDYAPAPGAAGRKLVPDLATDTGEVSSDGLTWTFHLKAGTRFDDGTAITSKDVKYGIERTFDRDTFFGPSYFVDLLDQGQNYPGPYKDTDPDKLGLDSVRTPNDSTIVFSLARPFADFRYVLALSIGAPVPQSADTGDGKDFEYAPVGSGPYKVQSYVADKSLSLVRNPYWEQSTDTVHSALPDRIELKFLTDQTAVENALLAGTADLDIDGFAPTDATETKILNDASLKSNTDLVYNGATRFLSLQTNVAPFDDYQCRRAVQYAVDRSAVRAQYGGQYNGGDIATTMLPPTTDGYDPDATPYGTTDGIPYPTEAKTQLAGCGKANGFSVTLAGSNGSTQNTDAMKAIQTSLAAVGIKVTIKSVESTEFYETLLSPTKLKAAKWGMVLTSWAADWPTGGGFLRELVEPGSSNNYSGLDDPDIDSAIDAADPETDPAAAADDWKAIDKQVM